MTVYIIESKEHFQFINTKHRISLFVDKGECGSLMRAKKAFRKEIGIGRKPIIWKVMGG